ncbi:MAG: DNA primase [Propionibacteriaceae bacterium]|nr:DNA primase [Propionibacteriaceae bacterium]
MASRINQDDIDEVRSRARIDDVVSGQVALKPSGAGTLKGLCPFHEERTPSFQVTPARGLYYCFGCGAGGDVVRFVQQINNLSFPEAIEFLAAKYGVQLRYDQTEPGASSASPRARLLEANAAAADFYTAALLRPGALTGRQFLDQRGFDKQAAELFGVGFAPTDGRALVGHLRAKGFGEEELIGAGLARRGGWDYFQGRLLWPIRDAGRAVLGFGARRVFEDDRMPAKYINTPETPVYKKSHVLYGLDLARAPIGKKSQAVIVEGYTDVMACHLAGVDTAVASCGTAFGDDHARMIQRLLGGDAFHGEVVFAFDGDEAGRKAALKVFSGDAHFASQTYVAIEPTGLDPCDLRLRHGDAALRELVGRREALYRFVMRHAISQFDLDRADGRLAAVRQAANLLASVRDESLRGGYIRDLAKMVGMELDEVRRVTAQAPRRPSRSVDPSPPEPPPSNAAPPSALSLPDPADRDLTVERDTVKCLLQRPDLFAQADPPWHGLNEDDFTAPAYRAVFAVGVAQGDPTETTFPQRVLRALPDPALAQWAVQLAIEPIPAEPTARHIWEYCAKLHALTLERALKELRSKLERTNPVTDEAKHQELFARLLDLQTQRRDLMEAIADPA